MKKIAFTLVAAGSLLGSSAVLAGTVIGGATLVDTVTVHEGTVAPVTYLSYLSGSNGNTGTADGAWFTERGTGGTVANALSAADHLWVQYDSPIMMYSATALNSVIAVPAIDHGWTAGNTGEFWESFEFRIFGCTTATLDSCTDAGVITDVWKLGVDNTSAGRNADDWTSRWAFNGSYNYFAIRSGDRLVGGTYSPNEGEIDALASGDTSVPEPASLALFGLGLAGLGVARRRKR